MEIGVRTQNSDSRNFNYQLFPAFYCDLLSMFSKYLFFGHINNVKPVDNFMDPFLFAKAWQLVHNEIICKRNLLWFFSDKFITSWVTVHYDLKNCFLTMTSWKLLRTEYRLKISYLTTLLKYILSVLKNEICIRFL